MKCSEMVAWLNEVIAEQGDLEVVDASDDVIGPEVVDGAVVMADRA